LIIVTYFSIKLIKFLTCLVLLFQIAQNNVKYLTIKT